MNIVLTPDDHWAIKLILAVNCQSRDWPVTVGESKTVT